MIIKGEPGWEKFVPHKVEEAIKEHGLFDYPMDGVKVLARVQILRSESFHFKLHHWHRFCSCLRRIFQLNIFQQHSPTLFHTDSLVSVWYCQTKSPVQLCKILPYHLR